MSWVPIESNPEVMNKFLSRLGVPEKWQIVDVLSLDKDMLGMIPRPTLAMILLFPTTEKYEKLKEEQEAAAKSKGQESSTNLYYLKQIISNSCGTVALVHSVANNLDEIQLGDGFLKQFLEDTQSLSPEERGNALSKNQGFINAHAEIASEGQSQLPTDDNPVIHHFVAFVHKNGRLYELGVIVLTHLLMGFSRTENESVLFVDLCNRGVKWCLPDPRLDIFVDGRKAVALDHKSTTPETFVEDAAELITDIMKKDPEEMRFTVCALSAKMD